MSQNSFPIHEAIRKEKFFLAKRLIKRSLLQVKDNCENSFLHCAAHASGSKRGFLFAKWLIKKCPKML